MKALRIEEAFGSLKQELKRLEENVPILEQSKKLFMESLRTKEITEELEEEYNQMHEELVSTISAINLLKSSLHSLGQIIK